MLDGITGSMEMSLNTRWETLKDREAWNVAVHGVTESDMTEQPNDSGAGGRRPWWLSKESACDAETWI